MQASRRASGSAGARQGAAQPSQGAARHCAVGQRLGREDGGAQPQPRAEALVDEHEAELARAPEPGRAPPSSRSRGAPARRTWERRCARPARRPTRANASAVNASSGCALPPQARDADRPRATRGRRASATAPRWRRGAPSAPADARRRSGTAAAPPRRSARARSRQNRCTRTGRAPPGVASPIASRQDDSPLRRQSLR